MGAVIAVEQQTGGAPHPNAFDRRRIERALETRKRYRYVSPRVVPIAEGYRIESPCCSRNIDPDGGIVDVALLQYNARPPRWRLYAKNHATGQWLLDSTFRRLVELLERVKDDPERRFWQ